MIVGWKRWVIFTVSLGLAIARLVWPDVKVDGTTVWLVALAAAVFLLPEIADVIPYVKKVKMGPAEVELRDDIAKLNREVERVQAERPGVNPLPSEAEEVIREAAQDPRAALLLLSTKIEQAIRERARESGLLEGGRPLPLVRLLEAGIERQVFPKSILPAFRDFWAVRNKVAHGMQFDVSEQSVLSLISLGSELLRALSAERSNG